MDNTHHPAPSDEQQEPGGCLETVYTAYRPSSGAAQEPTPPEYSALRWAYSQGYDGHSYDFVRDVPAPSPGARLVFPYRFDLTIPPPLFGCLSSGHLPYMAPPVSVNVYSGSGTSTVHPFTQQIRPGQSTRYEHEGFSGNGALPHGKDHDQSLGTTTRHADEAAFQRQQDQQWLRRFLYQRESHGRSRSLQPRRVSELKHAVYGAARLVSLLEQASESLRNSVDSGCVWMDAYLVALNVKRELQGKLSTLSSWCLLRWKTELSCVAKRRDRRLRASDRRRIAEKQREERISVKQAAIDKWRMEQIRKVEEKNKELELKLAADAVLCEVRKKQADVKRMQDVLRSLDKLRRLRKEAASRKGIVTEQECEEAFSSRLEHLRVVLKRRTAVYSAEEKALMVMLEGEQEEERRREHEKQVKKERDGQLQRKLRVGAILFGDLTPSDSVLQPFREYYIQAEHSLHALLHIRREWDAFVAVVDHLDSSPVPQCWILPDAPSDQAWASALHADTN